MRAFSANIKLALVANNELMMIFDVLLAIVAFSYSSRVTLGDFIQ
tara:strand:- start:1655 stop:1789 length:135 start_codon:yes stop_codon:yes gene_type:complete